MVDSVLDAGDLACIHHVMDAVERGAAVADMLALASATIRALAFAGPGEAYWFASVLRDDVISAVSEHAGDGGVLAFLEAMHESRVSVGVDDETDPGTLPWGATGAYLAVGRASIGVIARGGVHHGIPELGEQGEAGNTPGVYVPG